MCRLRKHVLPSWEHDEEVACLATKPLINIYKEGIIQVQCCIWTGSIWWYTVCLLSKPLHTFSPHFTWLHHNEEIISHQPLRLIIYLSANPRRHLKHLLCPSRMAGHISMQRLQPPHWCAQSSSRCSGWMWHSLCDLHANTARCSTMGKSFHILMPQEEIQPPSAWLPLCVRLFRMCVCMRRCLHCWVYDTN